MGERAVFSGKDIRLGPSGDGLLMAGIHPHHIIVARALSLVELSIFQMRSETLSKWVDLTYGNQFMHDVRFSIKFIDIKKRIPCRFFLPSEQPKKSEENLSANLREHAILHFSVPLSLPER
jgi:hypothetical protein